MLVNHEKILWAALNTPMGFHMLERDKVNWGASVVLWGPPGGGKTTAAIRAAKRLEVDAFVFDNTLGEAALGAVPAVDEVNEVLRFYPADFVVERFKEGAAGLVVCDDATTFPPSLQAHLLGLFLNKRLGSHFFGPRVRVIACANEAIDAPGGYEFASAVANRPCHLNWPDPDVDAWSTFMLTGANLLARQAEAHLEKESAESVERRVLEVWSETFAQAAGAMTGFVQSKRTLRVQPAEGDPQRGKAWPSPRTMEFATVALASSNVHGLNQAEGDAFVAGYVGEAFASEWSRWRVEADLPNSADFLDGRATFEHSNYRIDRTAAVLQGCIALLADESKPKRKPRTRALYKFLDSVGDEALDSIADVVVGSLYNLNLVAPFPEARPILRRLRPMLDATESGSL